MLDLDPSAGVPLLISVLRLRFCVGASPLSLLGSLHPQRLHQNEPLNHSVVIIQLFAIVCCLGQHHVDRHIIKGCTAICLFCAKLPNNLVNESSPIYVAFIPRYI